jgi:beta-glucosidase-like glycosyl hydrolase
LISINNATLSGIGGIIAFPDCYKSSKTIPEAKKKINDLSDLLTKKTVLNTPSHCYEITIKPFIGIDGNIETWGGLSALKTNMNPSIVNQAAVFKAIGINVVFGPNVDDLPVPLLGKACSRTLSQLEYVRRLSENQILPFMKHFVFPAKERKGFDTHFEVCKINLSEKNIRAHYAPYCLNEKHLRKPWGIMMGHQVLCNIDPNNSLSLSSKARLFVRNNFLSDPITISDALSMKGMLKKGDIKYGESAINSVVTDLILVTHFYDYASCVNKASDKNSKDQNDILFKILNVKYKLGLLKIKQLN